MKTIRMVLILILCFSANLAFAAAEDGGQISARSDYFEIHAWKRA